MASNLSSIGPTARAKRLFFDFDPDATTATDVSWQDLSLYGYILVAFFHSVGTGILDSFKILGNSESDGSGTDAEIKAHGLSSAPDAVGDYIFLEALASEFPAVASNLRYVSGQVKLDTATDEGVVYYELGDPKFPQLNLTADVIA